MAWCAPAVAQTGGMGGSGGSSYMINNIRVEGVENQRTRQFVIQSSGLSTGQTVTLPSGSKIAEAIRSIYEVRLFSDVAIHQENRQGNRVDLVIEVAPEPTLAKYTMNGIRGRHEDDLKKKIPLVQGRPVRPSDVERTKQVIKNFYEKKGYLRTDVQVDRKQNNAKNVVLTFDVDRKEKVEVHRIQFFGNERFDDGDLRGAMEETMENRWWRIWKGEKFKRNAYEEDLQKVIDHYRKHGYYDAQVVSDSVYYVGEDGIGIDVTVKEGGQYYVSDITWEGNTVFPDRALTERLGLKEGDVYNAVAMEKNLRGNKKGTDVTGMYMDQGYMRANVQPTVRIAGEDSLDITLDVREGDVYTFGDIQITGNTKTNDYVIRRELYTVPGERFSRTAIQESIRRLSQLKYFSKQSLQGGPDVNVDEQDKQANLTYDVEEVGSDQLELSGTFGQFGVVLQLGFKFNNFSAQNLFDASAWRPLPSGDGQQLSVNIRTNGRFYQNYSMSFTEPWFRGSPTPIGGSVSYSRYTRGIYNRGIGGVQDGLFQRLSTSFFVRQRLDWPDDKFMTGTTARYNLYRNRGFVVDDNGQRRNVGLIGSIPFGRSQSVSLQQSFSRNSLDNPRFPSAGSEVRLSVEVAPPIGDFEQYHKWKLTSNWNVPLGENFSFGMATNFGYIGTISGDPVKFERFEVGGTAFDYQGRNFGTDPVFVRGYPRGVIGPKRRSVGGQSFEPRGARVLNKYTSELRWMAVESQQLQARPYLYLDAVGAWGDLESYSPSNLYRSAGIGVKLFLPIVGMLEFNYGYNFDRYTPLSGAGGEPSWTFQFSLGSGR